ncbi:MAG: toxin-antitoxin system YwqK family antitoxin [Gammaproteobacteria bacterium]|uniref:Toxin-antitoxin system YwqK family antitoxin n=1 Tax=SAR86 cluster bacterium TaxID=2030880 RepID=A0A520MUW7_9GAMM|nr:MAG: hypothetical protein EVA99_00240 [SAR86 cluster bacterium]
MIRIILLLFLANFMQSETVETHYKTGELKERFELQGDIREGLYQKWYLNGQIGKQSFYKNGILDGELTTWYPNGVVKGTYPISKGKIEGTAKYYDNEGNLSWQVYESNKPNKNNNIDLSGWCLD